MNELKVGDKIPIYGGGQATVSNILGTGGQGIVYKTEYMGKEYALKWYYTSKMSIIPRRQVVSMKMDLLNDMC